ncbi:hypothetical protein MIMGU_mgv1a021550mg, partial [Erythranthe guttata]
CDSILVDGAVVLKDDETIISCGSEIIPGPEADVGAKMSKWTSKNIQRNQSSQKAIHQLEKLICYFSYEITLDPEHAKCSICLNIWHDVVTIAPCLHNFCNGCFSEWLKRCQEKRSTVLCPQCRAVVQFVGRNHFLHNIEEDIQKSDPSLTRSDEEIETLDRCSSIKSCLALILQVIPGARKSRKRARAQNNDENERDFPCPQCGTEYGGFQCSGSTVHLQCGACGGMMPDRSNPIVPQHCIGCDRAFCGAYWNSLQFPGSEAYPVCSRETLKPITEKCISKMGRSVQDVISEWITKWNRTRIRLNHSDMITPDTHLCRDCYDKFVSYLMYWFRVSLPKSLMPKEAVERVDCWYGFSCRTQHHNEEHARKRNHVCRPIRGDGVP